LEIDVNRPQIILHHYPRSPFAEKIRIVFGLKSIHWHSVEQPRMAPKPALTALTGGYRRIPVLQISADIYCDTRCILRELERRVPSPPLYPPSTHGFANIVAAWADRDLFASALGLVFGLHGDRFPPELHTDRAHFTAGRFDGWDSTRMKPRIPELHAELKRQMTWLESILRDGRAFMLGAYPSLADAAVYHPLWYARGNLGEDAGLERHSRLSDWMGRMDAIGHGTMTSLSQEDALSVARNAEPAAPEFAPDSASSHRRGERVQVQPTDWGFDPVEGELIGIDRETISLRRADDAVGDVVVHFPRDGFAITPAG
jgi:glutathione S-transferase